MKNKTLTKTLDLLLPLSTLLSGLLAIYYVFLEVKPERVMGAVQRIFYFHVGSAIASYLAIATLLLASLFFLANRARWLDALNIAAAEVAFLLCSITLASGMIWGHAAWNTWFRWEPRLVSFLILWLILLSLNLLRAFSEPSRAAVQAAVLGVVSAVTVPLMVYSIDLLPHSAQLHPKVISEGGLKDSSYYTALFLAMAALCFLQFWLVWLRTRVEWLRQKNEER